MKRKPRYKNAPKAIEEAMMRGEDVTEEFNARFPQFSPNALAAKQPSVKITLTLGQDAVAFFKAHAKKLGVPYQRMIRNLVDRYAAAHK